MNPCLILTHGNLSYTRKCVESLRKQDITVAIFIVDNGSKDETVAYAKQEGILLAASEENTGFSAGINLGLKLIFGPIGAEHCLVVGSDTILPPWFYSSLLSYNLPFVSGVAVEDMDQIANPAERSEPVPHPDFSAWLTTKALWNKLGGFSESMVSWASDCDLHVRAHRLGINLWKTNTPFFHVRSRTIELASPREKRALQMQADADRLTFEEIWKARVGSPQYQELFSPDALGIDAE